MDALLLITYVVSVMKKWQDYKTSGGTYEDVLVGTRMTRTKNKQLVLFISNAI